MSKFELINASSADQTVDAVVNAANDGLWAGGGIDEEIPMTWENNDSVDQLKSMLPLTIQMSMYGGFEQVGSLGSSIARNDVKITTDPGDIVLYSGDQIVVFYGSNSWSYTKLGHIDMTKEELTELLGNSDVEITLKQE